MPPLTAGLVILEPEDGVVVDEPNIVVRGLAPPGVTVTHDIPFWFDDHTVADSRGRWSFGVLLRAGENEFTFRIGSDKATARTITVHLDADQPDGEHEGGDDEGGLSTDWRP